MNVLIQANFSGIGSEFEGTIDPPIRASWVKVSVMEVKYHRRRNAGFQEIEIYGNDIFLYIAHYKTFTSIINIQ